MTTTTFTTTLGALLAVDCHITFDSAVCCARGDCGEDGFLAGWVRLSFGGFEVRGGEPDYEFIADPEQQVTVTNGFVTIKAIDDTGVGDPDLVDEDDLVDVGLVVTMSRPITLEDITPR